MKLPTICAALALALGLGACHGAPPSLSAPPSPIAGGVGGGKAHLYVYLGRTRGQLYSDSNGRESDFYINGIDVGTVGPAEYLQVDLEPGVYDFSWRRSHPLVGTVKSPHDYDMLQSGQAAFLALDVEENAGWWFGPLGEWIDPDTGHIADSYRRGRAAIAERRAERPDPALLARLRPLAGPATYLPASW